MTGRYRKEKLLSVKSKISVIHKTRDFKDGSKILMFSGGKVSTTPRPLRL